MSLGPENRGLDSDYSDVYWRPSIPKLKPKGLEIKGKDNCLSLVTIAI